MKIYVAGDPVSSSHEAIREAVYWWASKMGRYIPDFAKPRQITPKDEEFFEHIFSVKEEPGKGDTARGAEWFHRRLVSRAIEFAQEVLRKAKEDLETRKIIGYAIYEAGSHWWEWYWMFDVRTRDLAIRAVHDMQSGVPWKDVRDGLRKSGEPVVIQHRAPDAEGIESPEEFGDYLVVPIYDQPPKDWRHWLGWEYDMEY
jgi:hypothetical protein